MVRLVCLMCLVAFESLGAHMHPDLSTADQTILWIGHLHPVLLHFPVALVMMTGAAELLFAWRHNPLYDNAAKFMLVAGTILVIPTVLAGYAIGESGHFPTALADYYWWHRLMGFVTLFWMLFTCYLRFTAARTVYLVALVVLVLIVKVTAALGGALVWGPDSLIPPFL